MTKTPQLDYYSSKFPQSITIQSEKDKKFKRNHEIIEIMPIEYKIQSRMSMAIKIRFDETQKLPFNQYDGL